MTQETGLFEDEEAVNWGLKVTSKDTIHVLMAKINANGKNNYLYIHLDVHGRRVRVCGKT